MYFLWLNRNAQISKGSFFPILNLLDCSLVLSLGFTSWMILESFSLYSWNHDSHYYSGSLSLEYILSSLGTLMLFNL